MKNIRTIFLSVLLLGGASCGPTTDTVQAPFKMTSDVTSSTSGSGPLSGPAKARHRLEEYVASAYNGVSSDIARGQGEYLASLEVLAGIPIDERNAFEKDMQSRYAVLFSPELSHIRVWRLVVNRAWSAGYGKTEKIQNYSATSSS